MTSFEIAEVVVPDRSEPSDEFVEMVGVRNRIETGVLGTNVLNVAPEELLPGFRNWKHRPRRLFVARVGDQMVARAVLVWSTADVSGPASLNVEVLDSFRRRGIGTALLGVLEDAAAAVGARVGQSWVMHSATDGPRLASPTGFGSLPAEDPGARFLQRHGYRLEQVKRINALDLPGGAKAFAGHLHTAAADAGPDYRVIEWTGPTPAEWVGDLAMLRTAMSVEDPTAGMETIEDPWDDARIIEHDARQGSGGRVMFTAAAEHLPSGRLVGFTELNAADSLDGPVVQDDTLVLPAHRGHRLGMLVKAANTLRLAQAAPAATVAITFNAEENVPMLDVNDAIGFRPIGYEGGWQKDLAAGRE